MTLSEWDAYVTELEGQNMTTYIDLVNGAYQRFQENNGWEQGTAGRCCGSDRPSAVGGE